MKKLLLVSILCLLGNIAIAAYEPQYKEEKLNIKSLTPEELQQVQKDKEYQEQLNNTMQQQGLDYMYRMQQQMMQPTNLNPYGGYRY